MALLPAKCLVSNFYDKSSLATTKQHDGLCSHAAECKSL